MMPRFKAGEFGGVFFIGPEATLPDTAASPQPVTGGKFWLVNTEEEGPVALDMVCTHLGCLYKWEQANNRFECPCHGFKFTREGYFIEGPAPRSLDEFAISRSRTVRSQSTQGSGYLDRLPATRRPGDSSVIKLSDRLFCIVTVAKGVLWLSNLKSKKECSTNCSGCRRRCVHTHHCWNSSGGSAPHDPWRSAGPSQPAAEAPF
jgi:nitrite reductase/ring-hydroxylating ferredoxin subunit